MSTQKNLKVSAETHHALVARANRLGMKLNRLADALLRMALRQRDPILLAAIHDTDEATDNGQHITRRSGDTNQG
jgi:hypothetical protein